MYNVYRSFVYVNPDVPSNYAEYNKNTIFSIDKIYMFNAADATNNQTNKALWNLNLHQFTDISLHINCAKTRNVNESRIKKLYITNINFSDTISGNPNLYYKDVRNFGKLDKNDENIITDKLNFEVIDSNMAIDYSKPQIKSDGSIPINLSYINYDFMQNCIISDISEPITYDGSLLDKCKVDLTTLEGNINFTITIINNNDTKFICDVSIPINLKDDNNSIYNGFYIKEINNPSSYTFYKTN